MPEYLSTGSAVERALICPSSVALPHAHHTSDYTVRGVAIHAFLQAVIETDRDTALEATPEEFREVCAELNLENLDAQLGLAAEVAFAYNVETDTARELGRGVGRVYDDVGEDEIPCTLDVVGVRDLPSGLRRGLYCDWKSGWFNRRAIDEVTQIDFGALCVARAYGCAVVEGQLAHVHEDFAPWVQRKVIEDWELDAFASLLRERHAEWKKLRAAYREGIIPKDFSTGPWCDQCPARAWCPAQVAMVREILAGDLFDDIRRMGNIPDSALAMIWDQIHKAQSALSWFKGKVLAVAATRPLQLGKTDDGKIRWLAKIVAEGNEKLDGERVFDVVESKYGSDAAYAATEVVSSKKRLEEALKAAVPRGKKASAMRAVLEELRRDGGATRKLGTSIKEIALPAGQEPRDIASEEMLAAETDLRNQLEVSLESRDNVPDRKANSD